MSYLNIHSRPFYKDNRSEKKRVGRPRVRFRRTRWYKKNLKKKDWNASKPSVSLRPEDEQAWLEVLDKYELAFQDICKSFLAGYYQEEEYVASSWAGKVVFEKILELSSQYSLPMPRDIEKDDVENRLRYIWYQATSRYNQRQPSVPFRNYLFRMSLFELYHWVKAVRPIQLPFCVEDSYLLEFQETSALIWAMSENSILSTYEKMLMYHRYVQDMPDTEIAERLYCTRDKIRAAFDRIESKLSHSDTFFNLSSSSRALEATSL